MNPSTEKRYNKAFTLIELLVVISIVGILTSIAAVNMGSSRAKARIAAGQAQDTGINHAIGDQLIGEWLFDESSGALALDSSGNGRNGTITGASRVTGVTGSALSFVSGNYVSLGSDAALNPSVFTITAWIKPGANFGTGYNVIFSNTRDCCGTYNGILFWVPSNRLACRIWNNGAFMASSSAVISNDQVWTFVAVSYDGSKMSLYINGHLDSTANTALGIGQPASYGNYIGALAAGPGSYGMEGSIDQVRLYGNAIVAANIENIYLAERGKYLAKQ